jgi:hypothetical protein
MANTKISHLGDRRIAISGLPEIRLPALGNGIAKPGDVVGIVRSTGYATGSDIGGFEYFDGILDDNPDTAEDTAIVAGVACSVIVPQKGHLYRVGCVDLGGAVLEGTPMGFSATAGKMEKCAAIGVAGSVIHGNAYTASLGANGDTVVTVRWA